MQFIRLQLPTEAAAKEHLVSGRSTIPTTMAPTSETRTETSSAWPVTQLSEPTRIALPSGTNLNATVHLPQ